MEAPDASSAEAGELADVNLDADQPPPQLPPRTAPAAHNTWDRVGRNVRNFFVREEQPADQGTEMRSLNRNRATVSEPRLLAGAEADQNQQQQGGGSQVQQVQQSPGVDETVAQRRLRLLICWGLPTLGLTLIVVWVRAFTSK
jgi:hypothetical protein